MFDATTLTLIGAALAAAGFMFVGVGISRRSHRRARRLAILKAAADPLRSERRAV